MHIIGAVQTQANTDTFDRWIDWIMKMPMPRSDAEKKRLIAAGMADTNPDLIDPAYALARKIDLVDFVIPDDNYEFFMGVMKHFSRLGHIEGPKLNFALKTLMKLTPFEPIEQDKDWTGIDDKNIPGGKWPLGADFLYFKPLGLIRDKQNKKGVELT